MKVLFARCLNSTKATCKNWPAWRAFMVLGAVAGEAWIRQKIAIHSQSTVERHCRRRIDREFGVTAPSFVKVVQLRKTEHHGPAEPAIGVAVNWSVRWVVGGHWRNQFHPSTGERKLKYILPYVKGPDDKPLKVPARTVYAVNR